MIASTNFTSLKMIFIYLVSSLKMEKEVFWAAIEDAQLRQDVNDLECLFKLTYANKYLDRKYLLAFKTNVIQRANNDKFTYEIDRSFLPDIVEKLISNS